MDGYLYSTLLFTFSTLYYRSYSPKQTRIHTALFFLLLCLSASYLTFTHTLALWCIQKYGDTLSGGAGDQYTNFRPCLIQTFTILTLHNRTFTLNGLFGSLFTPWKVKFKKNVISLFIIFISKCGLLLWSLTVEQRHYKYYKFCFFIYVLNTWDSTVLLAPLLGNSLLFSKPEVFPF